MENLDSRLLRSQEEQSAAAEELKARKGGQAAEEAGEEAGAGNNLASDPAWRARLAEAQKRSRAASSLGKSAIGRRIAASAANKVAEGSNKIFVVLLIIALMIDILEYFDFGIFSSVVNLGIYTIVIIAGFFTWFIKNNNNKFSIFNLLKGQLWKYLVLPLFELVPLINVLPFWTGTVAMMWLKVKFERQKLTVVKADKEKTKVRYSAQAEDQEAA